MRRCDLPSRFPVDLLLAMSFALLWHGASDSGTVPIFPNVTIVLRNAVRVRATE